jgi:hypothetical protein
MKWPNMKSVAKLLISMILQVNSRAGCEIAERRQCYWYVETMRLNGKIVAYRAIRADRK